LPRTDLATLPSYTVEDQRRMARAKNYFAWKGRLVRRELGQRVVEVGCGLGNFTGMLLDREAIVALDAEPECIERIMARYPNQPNLSAFVCDAGQAHFPDLSEFHPDTCVCLNVLEHIEDDRQALRNMASVLDPGGVIVLIVPAFEALYGAIDRNLGHYRRYGFGSLRRLVAAAGLRVRKAHYMNSIGFFGWWANARLFRREAQSEGQIEFFDSRVVPILSRLESWAPPPFGQSLFAVLEKP
jgi:2-polyprenyl-3-methyl-5-hydroxy-6-metoxy-1,4-benzoquinol methylase